MNARNIALSLVFLALGYGIWHYHSDAGRLIQEMDQLKAAHTTSRTTQSRPHRTS